MNQAPAHAFIYGLVDPRQSEVVMYVGKTNNISLRLNCHRKDAKHHKENPTPVWAWILALQTEGIEPRLIVLEKCIFPAWKERERFHISDWRRKNPHLLNKLDGGNGSDSKERKEFCDKCGTRRILLFPKDTSFRCPVCRPKERRVYEATWNRDNAEYIKEYQNFLYREHREKYLAYQKARRAMRIEKGLCIYHGCTQKAETSRRSCRKHLTQAATKAAARRKALS